MPSLSSRVAPVAVTLLFLYNGLVIGVYAGSIPALRERFGLTALQMSAFFVSIGVTAIASMQVAGRLADRLGARRVVLGYIPLLIAAIVAIPLAPSYGWLLAAGAVLGVANGGIDVAMNAIGVQVEQNRPKPIMSFFHGTWSIGNLLGAGAILLLAPLFAQDPEPTVLTASLAVATLGVVALIIAIRITPETAPVLHEDEQGQPTKLPRSAYLLGLMAVAFGLGEGTAMDWSGLHVTEVTGVDVTTGSLGVTAVAAFMVVIRLSGDFLVTRFGRRAIVRFGGACSSLGYLVTAVATPLPWLLVGWAMVGLGIGMIAPQVYAVAGHSAGGRGLAVVVTFGYATFLIAPAVIGYLVSLVGIQATMFVPAILLSGLVPLAVIMPGKEPAQT